MGGPLYTYGGEPSSFTTGAQVLSSERWRPECSRRHRPDIAKLLPPQEGGSPTVSETAKFGIACATAAGRMPAPEAEDSSVRATRGAFSQGEFGVLR